MSDRRANAGLGELPSGWSCTPLSDVVDILDSQRIPVNQAERLARPGVVPYYGAAGQVGTIGEAIFNEPLVLLGEDGVQFFDVDKPKAYLIEGPAWVNNHAHVIRTARGLDRTYLKYFLDQVDYHGLATGTTRLKLTQAAMRQIVVALPPEGEQERLVAELERRLSHLEAAVASLHLAARRLESARTAVISSVLSEPWPAHWNSVLVQDAGEARLGLQRSPSRHFGSNMKPYLRVANVFEARIDFEDVMEMHFTPEEEGRYRLVAGDVLLNEGQSPQFLGRPAIWSDARPEMYFTNSLIRFRCTDEVVPEWALLVFRRHMRIGRFQRESRITTNIAHLALGRFKTVEFPIPPLDEQQFLVDDVARRLSLIDAAEGAVHANLRKVAQLRRSLLAAAFSGRLVKQDPNDEPAGALLERIESERVAQPVTETTRRSTRSKNEQVA